MKHVYYHIQHHINYHYIIIIMAITIIIILELLQIFAKFSPTLYKHRFQNESSLHILLSAQCSY
jgi:hypothetical protein